MAREALAAAEALAGERGASGVQERLGISHRNRLAFFDFWYFSTCILLLALGVTLHLLPPGGDPGRDGPPSERGQGEERESRVQFSTERTRRGKEEEEKDSPGTETSLS